MSEPKHFIYLVRPIRPGFAEHMTDVELAVLGEHFEYLERLLAERRLVMAGPCLDRAFGIAVLEAADQDEAARMMGADPAVAQGVFSAELHPFRISLTR